MGFHVPYRRNEYFTGREDILANLEKAFFGPQATTQAQAISGLGGIGKSQTTIEYAYRNQEKYRTVLWAQADLASTLDGEYRKIARLLNLRERDAKEADVIREAVKRWLATETGYLLILDNADTPDILSNSLPSQLLGHLLVTSRTHSFVKFNIRRPVELLTMPSSEAITFLLERTERQDADDKEKTAAAELARELGGLPLALEQAGAYIATQQVTFTDYLQSYRLLKIDLLKSQNPQIGDTEKSVEITWLLNFEAVEQQSIASAELLRVSAFFSPDAIPTELLVKGASSFGSEIATALKSAMIVPIVLNNLLAPLTRYSLIRYQPQTRTYDVHRLVQEVIKYKMSDTARRLYGERAVRGLDQTFPSGNYDGWPLCERLLPHALVCAKVVDTRRFAFVEVGNLFNKAGYYLNELARYDEAEPLFRQALHIRETILGENHPHTAQSCNCLGSLYHNQGNYAECEPLYKRSLKIRETVLGENHLDTATSLNNLAGLCENQSKYTEAEHLYKRALKIRETLLGTDHPDTATILNNLADLYYKQGDYNEAEQLFIRALAIREKTLGATHPSTANSLNNLANLYCNQRRYEEAKLLLKRAIEIQITAFGEKHPAIASSINNLATICYGQEQYQEAEALFHRALKIQEITLGQKHPDVATSLNNIAELYNSQGRYAEVEPLHRRALKIRETLFGENHTHTAASLNNLGGFYCSRRRYAEAKPLLQRALKIHESLLGKNHLDTASSLNNLASVYYCLGQYKLAEPLLRRALGIYETTFGENYPNIKQMRQNLDRVQRHIRRR